MQRVTIAMLILIPLISACSKKYSEKDMQEMQRKTDSVDRQRRLDEKLRMLDSLASTLDSAKIK